MAVYALPSAIVILFAFGAVTACQWIVTKHAYAFDPNSGYSASVTDDWVVTQPDADVAFAAYGTKRKPIRTSYFARKAEILAADVTDEDSSCNYSRPRQLVIFRAPSRHTYGFVRNSEYDLPSIELHNLLSSTKMRKNDDIRFIPVDRPFQSSTTNSMQHTIQRDRELKPKSRKQSKKKGAQQPHNIQSLYWIECDSELSPDFIAEAASRAILTHATFSIIKSIQFSEEDWNVASSNCRGIGSQSKKILEEMDVIDMSNPNMSSDARTQFIQRVSYLVGKQNLELEKYFPTDTSNHPNGKWIAIHHCSSSMQQGLQNNRSCHHIHFGYRTCIGPAGTLGAPSQTLRRTHRGILKSFALKNRHTADAKVAHITSTAMEPEIGFLMANLASVQTGARVLDPCCGSGRLLLYAAALGAKETIGVDSDPCVWKDAQNDFQRHSSVIDGRSPLAVPTFFHGDVQNPQSTEVLCSSNSIDAIVCDPPYNIGAPALVDGGKDVRPESYHGSNLEREDKSSSAMNDSSAALTDLVPSILAIARRVLVDGGKIVFFLPVRGEDMSLPLETLLESRGCYHQDGIDCLHLLRSSTRLQQFSPTFSRWLVCMEKRSE